MPDLFGGGDDDFRAANPRREVPALVDGDTAVFDSTIILEYIEDRWPHAAAAAGGAGGARPRAHDRGALRHVLRGDQLGGLRDARLPARHRRRSPSSCWRAPPSRSAGVNAYLERQLGERRCFNGERFGWGDLAVVPLRARRRDERQRARRRLGAWRPGSSACARGRASRRPSSEAMHSLGGFQMLPELVRSGHFVREYRDHRLEWMMRSGGAEIVLEGMRAAQHPLHARAAVEPCGAGCCSAPRCGRAGGVADRLRPGAPERLSGAHRDELAAQASTALGRAVTFATIGVSLRGGGSARVTDLRVADDPRFGGGDFVRAESAVVAVSLLDAPRGRLRVRSVVIDSPSRTGPRQPRLERRLAARPARDQPVRSATAAGRATPLPASDAANTDAHLPLESITLRDGTVAVATAAASRRRVVDRPGGAGADAAGGGASRALRGSPRVVRCRATQRALDGASPRAPRDADVRARWDPVPIAALEAIVPTLGELARRTAGSAATSTSSARSTTRTRPRRSARPADRHARPPRLAIRFPAIGTAVADLSGSCALAPMPSSCAETPRDSATRRWRWVPARAAGGGVAQCRLTAATSTCATERGDGVLHGAGVDATRRRSMPSRRAATVQVADGRCATRPSAIERRRDLQDGPSRCRAAGEDVRRYRARGGGCTGANGPHPTVPPPGDLRACRSERPRRSAQQGRPARRWTPRRRPAADDERP